MRVSYHPDFPKEIKRFQAQYSEISERLAIRFRLEVENAIERIKASPNSAGHFLNTGSKIVKEVRRCNLHFRFSFYMVSQTICSYFDQSFQATLTPLTWLKRLPVASGGEPPNDAAE